MKTTAKQFTIHRNIGIVQLKAEPETTFPFRPGGPELKSGGLVITESTESGVVGKLTAMNGTGSYLLLTDADILVGAKQNRIINKSMLLAPGTKTIIDVSCIERLRWQFTSNRFTSPDSSADHELRKAKAAAFRKSSPREAGTNAQGDVWHHIICRMHEENFHEKTESYHELAKFHLQREYDRFPACEPEKGCNGIAVVADGKVQCIDLFGTEDVYRYYFPLLRDSAFRMADRVKEEKEPDIHEAYFRVLDALDSCETASLKNKEEYRGAGTLEMQENNSLIGFRLSIEDQLIHKVIFGK